MGDDEHAHAGGALQVAEQLQDLGLNGDIQGGGGLVGDDQSRAPREGDRNVDALCHAAGDLVRVQLEDAFRVGDLHLLEQFTCARFEGRWAHRLVPGDHFSQVAVDRVSGVEAAQGVLGDIADPAAADRSVGGGTTSAQVDLIEDHSAAFDVQSRWEQTEGRQGRDRFPAAGFADYGDDLTLIDGEGGVVDECDAAVQATRRFSTRSKCPRVSRPSGERASGAGAAFRFLRVPAERRHRRWHRGSRHRAGRRRGPSG